MSSSCQIFTLEVITHCTKKIKFSIDDFVSNQEMRPNPLWPMPKFPAELVTFAENVEDICSTASIVNF